MDLASCKPETMLCGRQPELDVAANGKQVVQVTRQRVSVYDYSGKLLRSTPMSDFINNVGLNPSPEGGKGPFEPHVVFDEFIGRWLITVTCLNDCLLASVSADALGPWGGLYLSCLQGGPCLNHDPALHIGYLPDTEVPDLVVRGNDLVIATHGRSFYVLDGIETLRQLMPAGASRDVQLFWPGMAVRSMRPAYIDYFLKRSTDNLTINILDSAGKVVQTLPSSKPSSQAPATETETTFGIPSGPAPTGPDGTAGLNRFTWDLRYPGATVFPGMILRGGNTTGPIAVPGNYRVQLIVDGVSQTVPLLVTKDPRLSSVTQADLHEQFDLAMKVRDSTTQANQMVIRIRELKKQISARLRDGAGSDPHIADTAHALEAKLSKIEGELYQVRNRSPRDTLNYPIKLNNQLAVLLSDIEMGDFRPTKQMYTVFGELSASLAKLSERLNATETTDVAHLNDLLKIVRHPPVPAP